MAHAAGAAATPNPSLRSGRTRSAIGAGSARSSRISTTTGRGSHLRTRSRSESCSPRRTPERQGRRGTASAQGARQSRRCRKSPGGSADEALGEEPGSRERTISAARPCTGTLDMRRQAQCQDVERPEPREQDSPTPRYPQVFARLWKTRGRNSWPLVDRAGRSAHLDAHSVTQGADYAGLRQCVRGAPTIGLILLRRKN
jgi:hypothetical protein